MLPGKHRPFCEQPPVIIIGVPDDPKKLRRDAGVNSFFLEVVYLLRAKLPHEIPKWLPSRRLFHTNPDFVSGVIDHDLMHTEKLQDFGIPTQNLHIRVFDFWGSDRFFPNYLDAIHFRTVRTASVIHLA